ncbi:TetR/AcrR family transcriptional regulator [Pseudonocardia acaciae]|uniref:TetR/AcrR family transcriptional regulator n=1 Tax=Pseudonocardia acaciae TaxID=551276 RepID=UPI00048E214C|nr:TetR/AcrR family transcriptional regulator [Pseudonocardia acaciae]
MIARGKEREDAILGAAMRLLAGGGYEALTIDAVAAEAHASKATIYRRWRNKAELVEAALDAHDAAFNDEVPDTGSLRGDLVAVLEMLRRKAREFPPDVAVEMLRLMEHDAELAAALRRHLADEELSPFHAPLARAVERGEVRREVDGELVHDVAEAMIVHRLRLRVSLDDAFVDRLVDDVLMVLIEKGKS